MLSSARRSVSNIATNNKKENVINILQNNKNNDIFKKTLLDPKIDGKILSGIHSDKISDKISDKANDKANDKVKNNLASTQTADNNKKNDSILNIEKVKVKVKHRSKSEKKIYHDPGVILIRCDEDKFSFYNNFHTLLGSFTVYQLVKYVAKNCEKFLDDVSNGTSDALIETFICTNKTGKLVLLDHISSNFMGNLEMLIRLNNCLFQYEKEKLIIHVQNATIEHQKKIISSVKTLIFMLLNHTFKIIVTISDELKRNPTNDKVLENKLMKYSVGIVYRLSYYIKNIVDKHAKTSNDINDNFEKINVIKQELSHKISKLTDVIITQNDKIDIILDKLDGNDIQPVDQEINESEVSLENYSDNEFDNESEVIPDENDHHQIIKMSSELQQRKINVPFENLSDNDFNSDNDDLDDNNSDNIINTDNLSNGLSSASQSSYSNNSNIANYTDDTNNTNNTSDDTSDDTNRKNKKH